MPKIVKLSVISSALFLAQFASAADITVNPASSETTQVVRQGATPPSISHRQTRKVFLIMPMISLTSGKTVWYLITANPAPE